METAGNSPVEGCGGEAPIGAPDEAATQRGDSPHPERTILVRRDKWKPHYLPAQPYLALNRAVGTVDRGLDALGTFLVGSCLERPDFRDVDVRTIMADEAFDKLFPGGESGTDSDAFWSLLCESVNG